MFWVGPKRGLSLAAAAALTISSCGNAPIEADPPGDAGAGEPVCKVVGGAPPSKVECRAGTTWFFNFNPALDSPSQNLKNYQLDGASRAQVGEVLDLSGNSQLSPEQFLAQLAGEIARYYQDDPSKLPNGWTELPDATDSTSLLASLQSNGLNLEIRGDLHTTACNLGSNSSLEVGEVPANLQPVQFLFTGLPNQEPMPIVCLISPSK